MKKIYSLLAVAATALSVNAQIVINEVYTNGGASGNPKYKQDFVELKNIGTTSISLSGAYLQKASATGSFGNAGRLALPDFTLAGGQSYLIQLKAGSNTSAPDLPSPDFIPTGDSAPNKTLNLSSTNKIALTTNDTFVTSPTDANVLDFVGMGSANMFEGSGAATNPTTAKSISRINGNDTNDNGTDFGRITPTPEGMSAFLSTEEVSYTTTSFIKNTIVKEELNFATKSDVKVFDMNGKVVKSASVSENKSLNLNDLPKGMYIVTGVVDGKKVAEKIIKK